MKKIAVVTGGASGIGRRTAERLLSEGWQVWSLDLARAGHVPEGDLADREGFHAVRCNVACVDEVRHAFAHIGEQAGHIDALVCSAGVTVTGALADLTPEQVDLALDVNLKGPWLCVREAVPWLRRHGTPGAPSRVVIVSSTAGLRPKVGAGIYGAAKAAVNVLAGVFAVELAPAGIVVNVVAPGMVNTPMLDDIRRSTSPSSRFQFGGPSPLGRIAEADDIADAILFLLGDSAKFINGAVLPVDGGTRAAFVGVAPSAAR